MPDPTTTTYLGIPGFVYLWALTLVVGFIFVRRAYLILSTVAMGRSEPRWDQLPRRLWNVVVNVADAPGQPIAGADEQGNVTGDIAWGGNWFYLVHADKDDIRADNVTKLTADTLAIRNALESNGITGERNEEIDHIELFCPTDREDTDSKNFVLLCKLFDNRDGRRGLASHVIPHLFYGNTPDSTRSIDLFDGNFTTDLCSHPPFCTHTRDGVNATELDFVPIDLIRHGGGNKDQAHRCDKGHHQKR